MIDHKKNFLLDTDWFDLNFISNFLNEDLKIKRHLNEKRFSISEKHITSRVLNYWHEKGILTDDRPDKKGWRKFSIAEMIWISIISKLRSFGMDLDKILSVKNYLHAYDELQNKPIGCPLLDFYISVALLSSKPIKLIVFSSGEAILARQTAIDYALAASTIKEDYISIDLNRLINKGLKKNLNTDYLDYSLSTVEKELKESLHYKNLHSLTLTTKKGNEFILTKDFIVSNKDEMNKLLNLADFSEATTVKRGNQMFYKFKEKKKLKN